MERINGEGRGDFKTVLAAPFTWKILQDLCLTLSPQLSPDGVLRGEPTCAAREAEPPIAPSELEHE